MIFLFLLILFELEPLALYPFVQQPSPPRIYSRRDQPVPQRFGTTESDKMIYTQIEDALRSSLLGRFKGNNIRFTVAEGHVTLRGHVTSEEDLADLEEIISGIPGVRSLRNEVIVKTPREAQQD